MNNIYLSAEILLVSVSDIDTDNYRKTSKKVISILLEKRDKEPFKDMWNIPGLLLNDLNDTLFQCANRVLRDKVGIKDNIYLEQLYTFDRLNRDPKRRVITTSYIALIDKNKLKTQPKNTCWFNVEKYSNTSKWIKLTLSNGEEMTLTIPFSAMIDRIPNTIFYISSLIDESIILNMKERNMYELMVNLLNGYFVYIKELSLILAEDAVEASKTSVLSIIAFYSSFIFVFIFLIIIWNLLSEFLFERQKPINLFLTIKKQIFEDLKNASESFSNNLLNKLMGNEENEEENQKDNHKSIKENDINIVKFKALNETKKKDKYNKEQIKDFIKLVIFFVIIEAYIIFKFFNARNYVENIKKFLNVFNITYSFIL